MENTTANKERFLLKHQFTHQIFKDVHNSVWYLIPCLVFGTKVNLGNLGKVSINEVPPLVLKCLSNITNEDAKALALHIGAKATLPDVLLTSLGKEEVKYLLDEETSVSMSPSQIQKAFAFLESLGYYTGDGTEIQYGWTNLK